MAARFLDDGYEVVSGVLDPAAVAEVSGFLESELARFQKDGVSAEEADMVASGHFPLAARLSPVLWALPRTPALQSVLRDALGSERLFMHMPPVARHVAPGNDHAAVPAHQDISYNHHLRNFVTVWIPLVPIDAECGGVAVYEGSQRCPELLKDFSHDTWLNPVPTEGYRRVECQPMQPGDILVLNPWIIHASIPNRSGRTRVSIDMRFFGDGGGSTKHYLDLQSWQVVPPAD